MKRLIGLFAAPLLLAGLLDAPHPPGWIELEGGRLLEAGLADPPADARRVAAGDLVFAAHLEELDVAEVPGAGLVQAGFEGVEHSAQLEGAQGGLELMAAGHEATPWSPSMAKRRAGPCR